MAYNLRTGLIIEISSNGESEDASEEDLNSDMEPESSDDEGESEVLKHQITNDKSVDPLVENYSTSAWHFNSAFH